MLLGYSNHVADCGTPVKYDRLSFVDAHRKGGSHKSVRFYHDFAINGRALAEILKPGDFISPFGWLGTAAEREFFEQLLLRRPSALPSGRVPLYICPECADLGCGCLTVRVTEFDDGFVWSEFGFENPLGIVESYSSIHDFLFNKTEYYDALNQFGFDNQRRR